MGIETDDIVEKFGNLIEKSVFDNLREIDQHKQATHNKKQRAQQIAVAFSGGVDSAVLSKLLENAGYKQTCYVVGVKGCNDFKAAEQAAIELGIELKKIEVSESEVTKAIKIQKQILINIYKKHKKECLQPTPLSVSFNLPLFFVAKYAKEKCIFAGQGPDEMLGGYSRYAILQEQNLCREERHAIVQKNDLWCEKRHAILQEQNLCHEERHAVVQKNNILQTGVCNAIAYRNLSSEKLHSTIQKDDVIKEIEHDTKNLKYALLQNKATVEYFNKKLKCPYINKKIADFCLNLLFELKITKDVKGNIINKYLLRLLAKKLGMSNEIAFRKKKAAQYGSGFWKIVRRASSEHQQKKFLEFE